MELDLKIDKSKIETIVINNTSSNIRIWEFNNSWGWFSVYFILEPTGDNNLKNYIVRRKDREWTKDGPTYINISLKERYSNVFSLTDEWWLIEEDMFELQNKEIRFKAVFEILSSKESKEYKIYVGKIESDWVISKPPHNWLLSD